MLRPRPISQKNEDEIRNADCTTNNRSGFVGSPQKKLQRTNSGSKDNEFLKKVLTNEKEKSSKDNNMKVNNEKINLIKHIVASQINQDSMPSQIMQNTIKGKNIMMSPQSKISVSLINKEKNLSLLNLISSSQKPGNIINNRGLLYGNKPASAPYSNRYLISRQSEQ